MKILNTIQILLISLAISMPVASAEQRTVNVGTPIPQNSGDESEKLVEYLQNLGLYLGFDLEKKPEENPEANSLLNVEAKAEKPPKRLEDLSTLVTSFLGAIPVTAAGNKPTLVDPQIPKGGIADTLNKLANATFQLFPYNAPTPNQITVNPLTDQQKYQQDPVSQSILNIINTPDTSWCTDTK